MKPVALAAAVVTAENGPPPPRARSTRKPDSLLELSAQVSVTRSKASAAAAREPAAAGTLGPLGRVALVVVVAPPVPW